MGQFTSFITSISTRVNDLLPNGVDRCPSGVAACVEGKCVHREKAWPRLPTDRDTAWQARNTRAQAPERSPATTRSVKGPRPGRVPGWPIGINRNGIPGQAALPRLPGPGLTGAIAPAAGSHREHHRPCLNAGGSEEETRDCVDRPATQSAGHSPLFPGSDIRNGGVEYRCSTVRMEADAPVAPPAHLAKISAKAHHTRHS